MRSRELEKESNMGQNSKIEWTDHTFNPWIGCAKVSPGCAHCYAEKLDRNRFSKTLGEGSKEKPVSHWGRGAPRQRTSGANWKEPLKWDKKAAKMGTRERVFCASLGDWLDEEVPVQWLADLLALIHDTPHLDWLLLTKRPVNWRARFTEVLDKAQQSLEATEWVSQWLEQKPPGNVHIGCTVEDQARAKERIPLLLHIPAKVRFLSCEPLLGPVRLEGLPLSPDDPLFRYWCLTGEHLRDGMNEPRVLPGAQRIHQVICGGESGSAESRPMHPEWARSLRDQCAAAGVPFFFKQWGDWIPADQCAAAGIAAEARFREHRFADGTLMLKVGKLAAGRLLDGVRHEGRSVEN